MNLRRLLLDGDKAFARPSLIDIAKAIGGCRGIEAFNGTVHWLRGGCCLSWNHCADRTYVQKL